MTVEFGSMPETTYDDVIRQFVDGSSAAARVLEAWRSDPHKAEVIPFVEASRTIALYAETPEHVQRVCARTEHALGEVRRTVAESVSSIVDWHPSFAFEHVFHYADETAGELVTYQVFRDFCGSNAHARRMLLQPARAAVAAAEAEGADPRAARDAMRWRVGNAYLAHVKETFVVAVLREAGFDARYHVLADVLFRVDFWIDRVAFSLYVVNAKYRDGATLGRKPPPGTVLGNRFSYAELSVPTRREFGTVHLPDPEETVATVKCALRRGAIR
jgi:hypothetical protein